MQRHCHQSSDGTRPPNKASPQPSRPTSTTSSHLLAFAKVLSLGRESSGKPQPQPQPSASASASENPKPTPTPAPTPTPTSTQIQPQGAQQAPKPARGRVRAVTSKSMTTAPLKDKSKPHRRKYPR